MCGIAGSLALRGSAVEPGLVARMTARLAHRGPDDTGLFDGGACQLGHTRLSILDAGGGRQPMSNERGDVVVAFSGRVYNFAALRHELDGRGHRFRTRSDAEVIPHAYEEWGEAATERLSGMFAFALWDAARRRLVLARDRLGVKPLYYSLDGDRLLFASELKALLASERIERRLDPEALHDFLSLLSPPAPRALLAGLSVLEPGSTLTVTDGRVVLRRYFEPRLAPDDALDEASALGALEERLAAALRDQAIADVPVGAFLSGGIGSSLLVALLATGRAEPLQTFTVGFHVDCDGRAVEEWPVARTVARRFGTRHRELRVPAGSADAALLGRVLDHFDQPFGDRSAIPTWLAARETRRFVKTVLSGDGGDDLFGGHSSYRIASQLSALRWIPSPARRAFAAAARLAMAPPCRALRELGGRFAEALALSGLSASEAVATLRSCFDEPAKAALYRPEHARRVFGYRTADRFAVDTAGHADLPAALAACDLRHRLPGGVLCRLDMMSMCHGLEVRVPLLDERVVDLALRLPPSLRLRGGVTKVLLRRAAERWLPRAEAERPRASFAAPLPPVDGEAMRALVDETLLSPEPRLGAILHLPAVRAYARAVAGDGAGRAMGGLPHAQLEQRVYALVALERWMQRWDVAV